MQCPTEAAPAVSVGHCSVAFFLLSEIAAHECLQQLVAIQLADQRARAVVIRDIGGILREDIAYDLIDGVVALIFQRGINGRQDVADLSGKGNERGVKELKNAIHKYRNAGIYATELAKEMVDFESDNLRKMYTYCRYPEES